MVEFKNTTLTPEKKFLGKSTDTKPTTSAQTYDTFLELDTKKLFIYSEQNINPATTNGWWEV